ncbi:MAG: hypothetical protein MdMp014T_0635 [Treponematales bacterium]|jgi:hypothetical protein
MKIEIFTFCDFAQESAGKLTIVGAFDTILAKNFPCAHQQLSVVIRIRFDIWEFTTHSFRIETRDLNGEMHMEPLRGTVEAKSAENASAALHLIFSVVNLHFKTSGVINFVLYMDDKELGSIPLYLRKG